MAMGFDQTLPDGSIRARDQTPGAVENTYILFFRGEDCFLSENHRSDFAYPGDPSKTCDTVLKCFLALMAKEMRDSSIESQLLEAETASELWRLAKTMRAYNGMLYRSAKRKCLLKAYQTKMEQAGFAQQLVATGRDYLAHLCRHRYFGIGVSAGSPGKSNKNTWGGAANVHGKILMSIRKMLRRKTAQRSST